MAHHLLFSGIAASLGFGGKAVVVVAPKVLAKVAVSAATKSAAVKLAAGKIVAAKLASEAAAAKLAAANLALANGGGVAQIAAANALAAQIAAQNALIAAQNALIMAQLMAAGTAGSSGVGFGLPAMPFVYIGANLAVAKVKTYMSTVSAGAITIGGPKGSGKTTLMHRLYGMNFALNTPYSPTPTDGKIIRGGRSNWSSISSGERKPFVLNCEATRDFGEGATEQWVTAVGAGEFTNFIYTWTFNDGVENAVVSEDGRVRIDLDSPICKRNIAEFERFLTPIHEYATHLNKKIKVLVIATHSDRWLVSTLPNPPKFFSDMMEKLNKVVSSNAFSEIECIYGYANMNVRHNSDLLLTPLVEALFKD